MVDNSQTQNLAIEPHKKWSGVPRKQLFFLLKIKFYFLEPFRSIAYGFLWLFVHRYSINSRNGLFRGPSANNR